MLTCIHGICGFRPFGVALEGHPVPARYIYNALKLDTKHHDTSHECDEIRMIVAMHHFGLHPDICKNNSKYNLKVHGPIFQNEVSCFQKIILHKFQISVKLVKPFGSRFGCPKKFCVYHGPFVYFSRKFYIGYEKAEKVYIHVLLIPKSQKI